MKILVVEDDDLLRETLGVALEVFHHSPILLADCDAAIEYLSREWPDVMLLDLTLPGMSGEEVYASS